MASYSRRIRKNKDKKDTIYWIGQINENGVRKSFYGKTKKEVEAKVNEYLTDLYTYGSPISNESVILSKWVYSYLFTTAIHNLSPSTFDRYKGIYDNYIENSSIASLNVKEITPLQLQHFFNEQMHLAHASIKKIYFLLNQSFKAAIKNSIIRINPIEGVVVPNKHIEPKEVQILTKEQQRDYIIHAENESYGLLCITTLFTGMRLGEVTALRWENVDLDNGIISIKESVKVSKVYNTDGTYQKEHVTKKPKSKSSIREIPIPPFLVDKLLLHRPIKPPNILAKHYVFETANGTHVLDSNAKRTHRKICTAAKINPVKVVKAGKIHIKYKGVSFHALRHTFASRMIESGESIKVVQELLGHKDAQTTLNIYAHVLSDTLKATADKQQALFQELFCDNIS